MKTASNVKNKFYRKSHSKSSVLVNSITKLSSHLQSPIISFPTVNSTITPQTTHQTLKLTSTEVIHKSFNKTNAPLTVQTNLKKGDNSINCRYVL